MPLIPTLFVPILRVSKSKKGNGLKRGKMPVTNTQLGFFRWRRMIGEEDAARFADQSQSEVQ